MRKSNDFRRMLENNGGIQMGKRAIYELAGNGGEQRWQIIKNIIICD